MYVYIDAYIYVLVGNYLCNLEHLFVEQIPKFVIGASLSTIYLWHLYLYPGSIIVKTSLKIDLLVSVNLFWR